MPLTAIFRHEMRSLWASWLVRLWLAGSALLTLLVLTANWGQLQNPLLVGSILFPYLVFPWFLVVIVLGVAPVTGARAEALADGILSRPITRYEYLLASWAARVATVLGVFLVVSGPAVALAVLAKRPVPNDPVTLYGVIASLGLVGLVLTFLVSLGFLLGTLLRGAVVAMVVLVFVWYPINLILNTFALAEFSPISLNQALPTLLRQPWREDEGGSARAARPADEEAVAEQAAQFLDVLSGRAPAPPPKKKPGFFDRDEFRDFSLMRVVLGYGIPTLASLGLAAAWFNRRDL